MSRGRKVPINLEGKITGRSYHRGCVPSMPESQSMEGGEGGWGEREGERERDHRMAHIGQWDERE